jgi:hypothetical protein
MIDNCELYQMPYILFYFGLIFWRQFEFFLKNWHFFHFDAYISAQENHINIWYVAGDAAFETLHCIKY